MHVKQRNDKKKTAHFSKDRCGDELQFHLGFKNVLGILTVKLIVRYQKSNRKKLEINVFIQFQGQHICSSKKRKILLEWFMACYFVIIHLDIVSILNWSTSVHMAFVVWWSVQLGFFNPGCSLEAIPCKNRFTFEMMQCNSAAWHFLEQSSSNRFLSWNTVLCSILRFGPVLFSAEGEGVIRAGWGVSL